MIRGLIKFIGDYITSKQRKEIRDNLKRRFGRK